MTTKFGGNIKKLFPIFFHNPDLIYLDNGATTQKPQIVIDIINDFYKKYNANIHRGIYKLSEKSSSMYEEARKTVAKFINSKEKEIIFTSGTTDSINILVNSIKRSNIIKTTKPTILLTELEHHSNLLPFREHFPNAKIIYIPIDETLNLNLKNLPKNADIISITHTSNVTGTITMPNKIFKKYPKAIKILDSAQSIAHQKLNVKNLQADFIAFSGHKMYGPTGIGILFGREELLNKLRPLKTGGGTIYKVTKKDTIYSDIPTKHEAGTPPIAQAIALSYAIKFLDKLDLNNIKNYESQLTKYALNKLKEIEEIQIIHSKNSLAPVISFVVTNIHPHDVSQFLANHNIATRSGHHCAQIVHNKLNLKTGTTRVSFAVYNDRNDINIFIDKLKELIQFFK